LNIVSGKEFFADGIDRLLERASFFGLRDFGGFVLGVIVLLIGDRASGA
jgi:hypothetical protein